jgi:hypothetical protein
MCTERKSREKIVIYLQMFQFVHVKNNPAIPEVRERVVPDPDPDGPNIADAITDLSRLAATGRRTFTSKGPD